MNGGRSREEYSTASGDSSENVYGRLARNGLLNLLTQVLLMALAFWGIPQVSDALGPEEFGLLTILWAFVGYFSLLDLGVSSALTKFMAQAFALKKFEDARLITWTSLAFSAGLGTLSCLILFVSAPFVVAPFFGISPGKVNHAIQAFRIAGMGIPFMLVYGVLRGVQIARHRFGIVNIIYAATGAVQWIGTVVLLKYGAGLREVIALTVFARLGASVVSFLLLPSLVPFVYKRVVLFDKATFRRLVSFGGWLTVSQIVSPLFWYLDRILIGALISLSVVAYYAVPQELLARLLIIPASLTSALYPILSQEFAVLERRATASEYYARSLIYVFALIAPVSLVLTVFSRELLGLWMNVTFSFHSYQVLQVLAVGLFFCGIAQVPTTALLAYGRPDLTAKFHLVELVIMVFLNFLLIPILGLQGAAIVWTLRVGLDAVLLFVAARRVRTDRAVMLERHAFRTILYTGLGLCCVVVVLASIEDVLVRGLIMFFVLIGFIVVVWRFGFDDADRNMIRSLGKFRLLSGE